ncbi:MAG: hypothetical protein WAU58_10705 [Terriglobales bacterium]
MLDVATWTDGQIIITGFSGDYGKNGWKLTEGDEVEIAVWNPQNSVGPALYRVHVVPPLTGRKSEGASSAGAPLSPLTE